MDWGKRSCLITLSLCPFVPLSLRPFVPPCLCAFPMNCSTCHYPLWHLTDRTCPECASPFSATAYRFIPSSIQLTCPHCAAEFTGPDAGEFFPDELPCPRCHAALDIDALAIRPADPSWDPTMNVGRNPWLTQRSWFLRRWYDTFIMSWTRPGHLVRGTPPDAPLTAALGYLAISVCFGTLVSALFYSFVLVHPFGAGVRALPMCLAATAATFLLIPAWAVAIHLLLVLFRVPTRGVHRTIHAACYASGSLALGAIPFLGPVIGPFAFAWIAARTTARAQDTSLAVTSWLWLVGALLIIIVFGTIR